MTQRLTRIMLAILGGAALCGFGWLAVVSARKGAGPAPGAGPEAADPGVGGNVRVLPVSEAARRERTDLARQG